MILAATHNSFRRCGKSEEQPAVLVTGPSYVEDERLLRALTEECAKREDTVIYINSARKVVVETAINYKQCPLIDIMLRGQERGVGTCMDAMLYVLRGGARMIPMPKDIPKWDAACGPRTARMLLETMYGENFSPTAPQGILYLGLINTENLWKQDDGLHPRVGLYLCKTRFCERLMSAYVTRQGWNSSVKFMGHTSSDPTVDLTPGVAREESGFLHVKGKSGVKHTNQVLACWMFHKEFPVLHVVGMFTWEDVSSVINNPNIRFYPKVDAISNEKQQSDHVSAQDVRDLQARIPVHICASQAEGFGHYLNEARASGVAIISTNHPPMNELVTPDNGVLLDPQRSLSFRSQALYDYAALNAIVSPEQICFGVQQVLAMSQEEVAAKGRAARRDYLQDRAAFYRQLEELVRYLRERRRSI